MSSRKVTTKCASYLFADDVAEICSPLFNAFNLNYFDYVRIYPDNTCLTLVSDREWYKHYVESAYPFSGKIVTSGVNLWKDYYMPESCVRDQSNLFNHYNGATIFTKNEDYIEYFDVAAPAENHNIFNCYLNNLQQLNQFLFYFKEKAVNLIQDIDKKRIMLPSDNKIIATSKASDDFLKQIERNKVCLNFANKDVILTRREYECLLHLSQGRAIKEIAKILNIAPKTAEEYLANVRKKTNCFSRMQLIDLFLKNFT